MASATCRRRIFRLLEPNQETRENALMEPSPQLEAFFELCKRIYERMEREGTWPWTADPTNPEDMIDSKDTQNDV